MKKILAMVLALTLSAVGLVSCGDTGSYETDSLKDETIATTTAVTTTKVVTTTTKVEAEEDSISDEEYLEQFITDYVNTLLERYPEFESADEDLAIDSEYYSVKKNSFIEVPIITKIVTLNGENYSITAAIDGGELKYLKFGLASGDINGVWYKDWNELYDSYYINGNKADGHITSVEEIEQLNRNYLNALFKIANVADPDGIDEQIYSELINVFFNDFNERELYGSLKHEIIESYVQYNNYVYGCSATKYEEGYFDTCWNLYVYPAEVLADSDKDIINIELDGSGNMYAQEETFPEVDQSQATEYAEIFYNDFSEYIDELKATDKMPMFPYKCEGVDIDGRKAVGAYAGKIREIATENDIHGYVYLVYTYVDGELVSGIYYSPEIDSEIVGVAPNAFYRWFSKDVKTYEDACTKWDGFEVGDQLRTLS